MYICMKTTYKGFFKHKNVKKPNFTVVHYSTEIVHQSVYNTSNSGCICTYIRTYVHACRLHIPYMDHSMTMGQGPGHGGTTEPL